MKKKIFIGLFVMTFFLNASALLAKEITLQIKDMTCAMCAAKVEGSIKKVDGVSSCSVDHASGKGTVTFDESKTNADKILEACNRTGFKCQL